MTEKKVILISGGSDGLGKALATRLSPEHQVVILSHNEEKLKQVSSEIACDYVVADVTDFASLETAVKKVQEKFSRIDILINNAGIWLKGNLIDHTPSQIEEVLKVNTLGTIFLTKLVLPMMKGQGGGRIINIISQDGLRAKKDRSVYSTSKWAITGFTKCLQEDFSEFGINVTGVYPGLLKTKLFEKQGETRDLSEALEPTEVSKLIQFVINLPLDTFFPEIVIKNLSNTKKMDDTNAPKTTLDINPDMMASSATVPTTTPVTASDTPVATAPVTTDVVAPVTSPLTENATMPPFKGVIDITPGGTGDSHPSPVMDLTPPVTEVTTPGIKLPIDQGVIDITPEENTAISAQEGATHLTDLLPQSAPVAVEANPSLPTTPEMTTTSTPVAPPAPVTTSSSPFAEDPSAVQLGK